MHRDNGYFTTSGYRDKLMPGKELNILHSIDFREYYVGQSDMPELVLKTEDELEAMRQARLLRRYASKRSRNARPSILMPKRSASPSRRRTARS